MTRLAPLAALAGLVVLAACVKRPPTGGTSSSAADSAAAAPVTLTVQSHHRANVVVYAVRGTLRQRLGTVTAASTARLTLPPNVVRDAGGFVLLAEPIGGDTSGRTDVLHVFPGQRLVWTLESRLTQSAIAIY